jgi:hypothetical protein
MVAVCYRIENQLVYFKADATLNLQGIIKAVQEWMAHPQFTSDANMLWDLRKSHWTPAIEEFFLVSDQIVEKINTVWHGDKIACVVTTATEAALIDTQLDTFAWNSSWRGFNSYTEAESWLLSG